MYLAGFMLFLWLGKCAHRAQIRAAAGTTSISTTCCSTACWAWCWAGAWAMCCSTSPAITSRIRCEIFAVWKGGMSFHGGFLGVLVAMGLFARKKDKPLAAALMDFIAPLVPPGLAAGRIGNFINGELWGRPTDLPWGMVFPQVDAVPRHPSQLYEFGLEGMRCS